MGKALLFITTFYGNEEQGFIPPRFWEDYTVPFGTLETDETIKGGFK